MPSIKHRHKYRLRNLTRNSKKKPYYVYHCVLEDCTHFVREDLIDGKIAACYKCDEPFKIKEAKIRKGNRRVAKLICDSCVNHRDKDIVSRVDTIADELINMNLTLGLDD